MCERGAQSVRRKSEKERKRTIHTYIVCIGTSVCVGTRGGDLTEKRTATEKNVKCFNKYSREREREEKRLCACRSRVQYNVYMYI